jgi:glutamine cyclotransferase
MKNMRGLIAVAAVAIAAGLTAWAQLATERGPQLWSFDVVAAYPHDPAAFTQGLAIDAGAMYEGTGQYGASSLRRVDVATGRVEKLRALGPRYFGEGIAVLGERIYQLTWQNQVAIVYDRETFDLLETFSYAGEGWGLTHDGTHLILSDGSATLRFYDPQTFAIVRSIEVRDGGRPISQLNELEYVDGEIWSNIWHDDRIVRISPADGAVLGWIDLATLYPRAARGAEAVLNGIAYDADRDRLFVTGKYWPQLFEIKIVRR